MPKRYLIVSSREGVRGAFSNLLKPRGIEALFAEDVKTALQIVDKQKLQAAIIESKDADPRANKLRQQIIGVQPQCRVALVTQFNSVLNSTDLFRRGGDEYLLNDRQLLELIT